MLCLYSSVARGRAVQSNHEIHILLELNQMMVELPFLHLIDAT